MPIDIKIEERDIVKDRTKRLFKGIILFINGGKEMGRRIYLGFFAVFFIASAVSYADGGMDLIRAVGKGDIKQVQHLLDKEVDVNAKAPNGAAALFAASYIGRSDIADILLNKGAKVNAKDNRGNTALMAASYKGHFDVVKLLIATGADVNMKDNTGETALMASCQEGHTRIAKLLLQKGANVNAIHKPTNATALYMASQNGHEDIVQMLKKAGAKK